MVRPGLVCALSMCGLLAAMPASGQENGETRISVRWQDEPVRDVLLSLAEMADRSIVVGGGVSGVVTATIEDQPWDAVLRAVVEGYGLVAIESESGIIRIVPTQTGHAREESEAVVTRVYRLRYTPAEEMEGTLAPLLSTRGTISVAGSTNTVVVTDVPRVQSTIARLLR